MADSWLIGVYYGEFVTADLAYAKRVWKHLGKMRSSPFLEFSKSREYLTPNFFFLRPVHNATVQNAFDNISYGLPHIAYESIEGDRIEKSKKKREGLRIRAKGTVSGKYFVVDAVPRELMKDIREHSDEKGKGVCVLSLTNALPDKETYGCSRTGTFFAYEIRKNCIAFEPLAHNGTYLVGKGVLVGAWPHLAGLEVEIGGMEKWGYIREFFCPLTIGGSSFERDGSKVFIVYRGVKTDLRVDMPAVLLFVNKAKGFGLLAENLGISVNCAFGRYIEKILQRNILADGNIVDYIDINNDKRRLDFDIRKNRRALEKLVKDVFALLFLCALVSVCGENALDALKDQERFAVFMDNEGRFEKIKKRYHQLRVRFTEKLESGHVHCFRGLENVMSLFELSMKEGWQNKRDIQEPDFGWDALFQRSTERINR